MPESRRFYCCTLLVFLVCLLSYPCTSDAVCSDSIEVLKISASDGVAVIRTPSESYRVVRVGDRITECQQIIEIASGLLVIRETADGQKTTVVLRITDGGQNVQRLSPMLERSVIPHTAAGAQEK